MMDTIKYKKPENKIRAILKKAGFDIEVKLEQIAMDNGIVFEAESFESGQPVFVIAEGERLPVPVGEFELPDGRVLVVVEEGVIAEMRDAEGEPEPEEEQEAEMEATETPEQAKAKKVVEEVRKETHFSAEESYNNLLERLEALEAKVGGVEEPTADQVAEASLEEGEELVEVVEAPEMDLAAETPEEVEEEIVLEAKKHNPETWNKKVNTYSQKFSRPATMHEKILKHLYS